MTTNTPGKMSIEVLDALLENELMLKRAGKLGDFLANGTGARYLRQPRLTVAQHFDIEPAFLILDPLLGSLGVVERVPAAIASVEEFVRRAVDHAAYLRHLLLRDQSRKARHALAVELVLLVDGAADDPEAALGKLGEALRKTLRESDSLFHVGVGVLEYCEDAADFGRRLRRAFPWLLTATTAGSGPSEPA